MDARCFRSALLGGSSACAFQDLRIRQGHPMWLCPCGCRRNRAVAVKDVIQPCCGDGKGGRVQLLIRGCQLHTEHVHYPQYQLQLCAGLALLDIHDPLTADARFGGQPRLVPSQCLTALPDDIADIFRCL